MLADRPFHLIAALLGFATLAATSVVVGQLRQVTEIEIRLDDSDRRFHSIHAATAFNANQDK